MNDFPGKLDCNREESVNLNYQYISAFKNPGKLPITQIHLERVWFELKKNAPKNEDISKVSKEEFEKRYYERKTEIIPALDQRWLPKLVLYPFEPYNFASPDEENSNFIVKNVDFSDTLDYFSKCDFHQFWCSVIFENSSAVSLRSFLLNPIFPYQMKHLNGEFSDLYRVILEKFLLVYKRLIKFDFSETENIPEKYGLEVLKKRQLINLPIVNTLTLLYKTIDGDFANRLAYLYFDDVSEIDFRSKEIERSIEQSIMTLRIIEGRLTPNHPQIPHPSIPPKPLQFDPEWVQLTVDYLLHNMALFNSLFRFSERPVGVCFDKQLPFELPRTYVAIYRAIYELIGDDREEFEQADWLKWRIFDSIRAGREEFVDCFHSFVSYCLDETLENVGDDKKQEQSVEMYLKLLNAALDEEFFISDYDAKYSVANSNEIIESCTALDSTRTEFIISCINKLPRRKILHEFSEFSKSKLEKIEEIFKKFKPVDNAKEKVNDYDEPEKRRESSHGDDERVQEGRVDDEMIEEKIREIMALFPHFGDGFALQCLQCYNFNEIQVINAVLEENLPPHLYEIPFDSVRIPPEKPDENDKKLTEYRGKKQSYDDALTLLDDKKDIAELKKFVLEGVQYSDDYLYDDEYDDRDDDDMPIKVADDHHHTAERDDENGGNPNRKYWKKMAENSSDSDDDDEDDGNGAEAGNSNNDGKRRNFCEDPAVLRARREAKFQAENRGVRREKKNLAGKPKGQGQDKEVLKERDRKNTAKSSRANHNRKVGASWKRNRGMLPM
ncbi:unnamed protein product [Phyllotreta striolata]|uniref:CUE domain-containing protein n=1 Tax=Phyllotreta striolata TaxID=444603 RepID=A0A9N9TMG9_PHYSR|nr:unnamed protein product [Phyllotreta striolata]